MRLKRSWGDNSRPEKDDGPKAREDETLTDYIARIKEHDARVAHAHNQRRAKAKRNRKAQKKARRATRR